MLCLYGGRLFFCKHKTAYERRISDWSSDVCSSDLDAETEASKTNEREGYAIDSAPNLWPGAVGAGRVGTAEAGQDDGVDLCAAGPRSGPCGLPLPPGYDDDATLERLLFRRIGRPPQNLTEPDWPLIAREIKRKRVKLGLLWQENRAAHPMVTAIPGDRESTRLNSSH